MALNFREAVLGTADVAGLLKGAAGAAGGRAGLANGGAAERFSTEKSTQDGLADVDRSVDLGRAGLSRLAVNGRLSLVGRKLEFLTQEMSRETNTIGSKANDVEISRCVFEMKGALEKVRELIQNVE